MPLQILGSVSIEVFFSYVVIISLTFLAVSAVLLILVAAPAAAPAMKCTFFVCVYLQHVCNSWQRTNKARYK